MFYNPISPYKAKLAPRKLLKPKAIINLLFLENLTTFRL
jgi:hypothetical protein